jgi:hypothetical protein
MEFFFFALSLLSSLTVAALHWLQLGRWQEIAWEIGVAIRENLVFI